MKNLFGFVNMAFDYESRKVANFDSALCTVDTCLVTDGKHNYETAVAHKEYNNGKWIIVEAYETREQAEAGHKKWVEIMTIEPLPDTIVDCQNSAISTFLTRDDLTFNREPRQ